MTGAPVVGYGSAPGGPGGTLAASPETPDGDRLTMDFGIPTPPSPYIEAPPPPPAEPFRFRASVARPGDTLLLCSPGLADPLRGEPALADELAARWSPPEPPGPGGVPRGHPAAGEGVRRRPHGRRGLGGVTAPVVG